ncbi:MAG: hypothetical protein U9Q70_08980 [Chloroflexota bacterium]|nr:hypothetical protein [Chloroflexota bacterium]
MTALEIITGNLGLPIFIGTLYIGWLLMGLSQRLGVVTKMKAYYRWFNLGNILISISLLSYIFRYNATLAQRPQLFLTPLFTLLTFHLPLALGVVLNVTIALIYWNWLGHK